MTLQPGARLGPYEILSAIGAGGMGEVYRARDRKLQRDVAIKVLPEGFAHDAHRLARFEREARTLAALNHPNIAAIYGVEEAGGVSALVMELVEGPTLADRLAQGAIPPDEALPIAKQIIDALEAAHGQGIVHRDLKPANIKIKGAWGSGLRQGVGQPSDITDGTVKVLDFGLATSYGPDASAVNPLNSPTMTARLPATDPGMILGTAAYMSPEQAKGRQVDKRSDLFAFGCVLYEMLTGYRAFEGESVTDILSAVLRTEPDWTRLPPTVPLGVRTLLRLCLEKNAKNRRSDAADVRLDIDAALKDTGASGGPATAARPPARQTRLAWIAATLSTLVAAGLAIPAVRYLRTPLPAEMRLEITTPSTTAPLEFALSPDGQKIVFIASDHGPQRLWLRALDKTDARPLSGTEGADWPFWSPDSRSVGFFASGKLYRIDISGGPPQFLASASGGRGGTWNRTGTIVFSPRPGGALMTIGASGGTPVALTKVGGSSASNVFPHFLPDGRRFVFYVIAGAAAASLYLGSLEDGEAKQLAATDSSAEYLAPGFLVFQRQTALMAQRLDLSRGELTGELVTLADPVGNAANGGKGFSVSDDGRVAYRSSSDLRQVAWVDRTGKAVAVVGAPDPNSLSNPELSPDGSRLAVTRPIQSNTDIWLMDLARGRMIRFTFDPAVDSVPLWSPDGREIAFASSRTGGRNLYVKPSSGAGDEHVVLETANIKFPRDWSHAEGRFLLYSEQNPKTGQDLLALPMFGAADRRPAGSGNPEPAEGRSSVVVANTVADESNGQFSPDDRWVAYETNASAGGYEIFVQPFPQGGATKWQVSTSGGTQPRWSADSKELYFIAADGMLMAAPITVSGATFSAGTPVALFPAHVVPGAGANKQQYAVARDGRFLMVRPVESDAAPITLLLNWRQK